MCVSRLLLLLAATGAADAAPLAPVALPEVHAGTVIASAFSEDARWLATAGADGTVRIWDVPTRTVSTVLDFGDDGPSTVALSPDASLVALGWTHGRLEVRTRDGEAISSIESPGPSFDWMWSLRFEAPEAWVGEGIGRVCRWSLRGAAAPACSGSSPVRLFGAPNVNAGVAAWTSAAPRAPWSARLGAVADPLEHAFEPDFRAHPYPGARAVAWIGMRSLTVAPRDGAAVRTLRPPPGELAGAAWRGGDLVVFRCDPSGPIAYLDTYASGSGVPRTTRLEGTGAETCQLPLEVGVSPDGRWALVSGRALVDLDAARGEVLPLATVQPLLAPAGDALWLRIRGASADRTLGFSRRSPGAAWLGAPSPASTSQLVATLDGATLVGASHSDALAFDPVTGAVFAELPGPAHVEAVAAARDSVLVARRGGALTLWSPRSGAQRQLGTRAERLGAIALSPDASRAALAIQGDTGQVVLVEVATDRELGRTGVGSARIEGLVFDASGRLVIALSSWRSEPIASLVLEPDPAATVTRLPPITRGVQAAAPCGDGLVLGGRDRVLRMLDGAERLVWSRPGLDVIGASADARCSTLAVATSGGAVLLLDAASGAERARVAVRGRSWLAAADGAYDGDETGVALAAVREDGAVRPLRDAVGRRRARGLVSTLLGGPAPKPEGVLPEVVAQIGQFGDVGRLALSASGRTLAVSAGVNDAAMVRVWDLAASKLVRSFRSEAKGLDVSPDGTRLAIARDGRVALVDPRSGATVEEVPGIGSVRFHPREPLLAVETFDRVDLYALGPARRVASLATGPLGAHELAFSPEGAVLAALATPIQGPPSVTWFDVPRRERSRSFTVRQLRPGAVVSGLAVGRGGRAIAVSTGWEAVLVDGATGKERWRRGVRVRPRWEGDSEELALRHLAFSPDGTVLLGAAEAGPVVVWRVSDGAELRRIEDAYASSGLAVSPEGLSFLAATYRGLARFDLATGARLEVLGRRFDAAVRADPSRLGLLVASGAAWTWDAARGTRLTGAPAGGPWRAAVRDDPAMAMSASADGQVLAVASGRSVTVRERTSDTTRLGLGGPWSHGVGPAWGPLALDRDGGHLAVAGSHGASVLLWDTRSGRLAQTLLPPAAVPAERSRALVFSPDGRRVALCGGAGLVVWTVDGTAPPWFTRSKGRLTSGCAVAFSPDGARLAYADGTAVARVHAADGSGDPVALAGQGAPTEAIAWARGALVTGGADGGVVQWDEVSGRAVRVLSAHDQAIAALGLAAGGRVLVSSSEDRTHRLWSTERELAPIATVVVDGEDLAIVAPDGAYAATRGILGAVGFRLEGRALPVEQFELALNRPGDVLRQLGAAPAGLVEALDAARARRLRRAGTSAAAIAIATDLPTVALAAETPSITRSAALRVRVRLDDRVALARFHATIDDVPMYGSAGRPVDGRTTVLDVDVPLPAGIHKLQLSVVNSRGQESLRLTRIVHGMAPSRIPNLHVIALGVSRYRDERRNLALAAKDASDVAAHFRGARGFGNVVVHPLLDEDVTRARVLALRAELVRSRPEDLVVLFLAGHGLLDRAGNFYFGTWDVRFDAPEGDGLRFEELEELLDGIPARQKLLLVDACHSGEADERLVPGAEALAGARGITARLEAASAFETLTEDLFADVRRGSGVVAIAAARAHQVAFESASVGNGYFTRAVIEALATRKADADADGRIRVSELRAWVVERVSQLSHGAQVPVVRRENLANDFSVP